MKNKLTVLPLTQRQLWNGIVVIAIALGVLVRVTNLAQPVYWVDEVATSMRVSGYTQAEVVAQVANELPLSVSDLQRFQTIRSAAEGTPIDRPLANLMRVLAQSPEHAPLYFVLARFWAEIFGMSATAMRSLPVVFGLLGLPAMYGLCQALFSDQSTQGRWEQVGIGQRHSPLSVKTAASAKTAAQVAVVLLAVSPFFVAYAQEARPYSLWILLLLLTTQFLWRSLQTNQRQWWIGYGLCLVLALYTSLLTVLVVLGQGLAVLLWHRRRVVAYGMVSAIALSALLPWVWVVFTQWQTLQSNTRWMEIFTPIWATLGTWFYSLAVLFFDVPVAEQPLIFGLQVITAAMTIGLIGYASWFFIRQTRPQLWGVVLATAFSIPGALLLIDLVRSGQAAATPRYLMPTHLAVLIALAYLLGDRLFPRYHSSTRKWRLVTVLLLSVSLISCLIPQPSPYLKSRNLSNAALTAILNEARSPNLITTPHYIQDLISFSYDLAPDITFYVLAAETASPNRLLENILNDPSQNSGPTFLLAPSAATHTDIKANQLISLTQVYQPPPLISGGFALTLWRVEPTRMIGMDFNQVDAI
ncbi:glycosyltransferase family 39 protein [cf. Phormidesmis sp. LEGE 11477]|uniref:glycosyltransferase family 39 protein n=1 Tax=cf. Phormidesmis sp. LEGE 11477 TaxID=1828680 RepID=UPI00187F76D2|nr:glycosyltransferase family 39 protein [cf. Phormidesmis sp. LEGE 11477]MBE9064034.1 glycosyltransferase family 39 protein [cf. Phormidesmis sp. LEGE 11477]